MTEDDWKTLRVPPEAYEEAKEQKEANDRTWGEQLVCDNPTTTEVVEVGEFESIAATIEAMDYDLSDVMASLSTVEERTGRIEKILEELR